MNADNSGISTAYQLYPIGKVHASEKEGRYTLQIKEAYRPALNELAQFSHVMIFWWADQMDTAELREVMTTELPYAPGVEVGVFACRSEYRPNPIAVTTMPILDLDLANGVLTLPWIDAFDGTPVLDLKPYIPISDRIRDYQVAEWISDWPEWMEDAAAYFAENPTDFGE